MVCTGTTRTANVEYHWTQRNTTAWGWTKRESQAKPCPEVKGKQDVIPNKNVFLHTNVLLGGHGSS